MTVEAIVDEDGNLPAAREELADAVAGLCEPVLSLMDGKLMKAPSLYMQLFDAVSGEQAQTGSGTGSKSRPPFWTDAFDVKNEIDTALEIWQPQYTGVPPSVGRMRGLLERKWRPQDVHCIQQITTALGEWKQKINLTLTPTRKWSVPNACPNCGTKVVHRPDSGGLPVRQPALQFTDEGCKCLHCQYVWGVERFQILAAALRQEAEKEVVAVTAAELIEKLSRVAPDTMVVVTDSTAFRYITEFTARSVRVAITNHHSLGPMVQRFNERFHSDPVHVVVLSPQDQGEEL
ncbi:Gp100 [Mycolicibacterium canariasense]|uniref:Gp100 n=1 Tax=Mycolicibacterium canariasense TaxID=228230 RepID=A0A100WCH8_MYCCR|nr:hypothetical protein [Mycolicibacterium canariasense]MCV7212647.1 hypothetical protein [Mycolicibacterium canariasense]ORV02517.1 hypothetical protein AWB94_00835 [Mycolicibacterium canariasense]GAS95484.1 Gp100 [Mycolicibacterium canariasense]